MDKFLRKTFEELSNLQKYKEVKVILGNEDCDLDSVVATLVMAYFYFQKEKAEGTIIIPVLNAPRRVLALRSEVVFFMEETDLQPHLFPCRDDINLEDLHNSSKLKLVLVNDHLLPKQDEILYNDVVEIIHHKPAKAPRKDCRLVIKEVGSCCTLVADKMLNEGVDFLDPQIALLLYGTILLSTHCLAKGDPSIKEMDHHVVAQLEPLLEGVSREEVYHVLEKARTDNNVSGLIEQMAREVKVLGGGSSGVKIGFVAVPFPLKEAVQPEAAEVSFHHACTLHGCHILFALDPLHHLAAYSPTPNMISKAIDFMKKHQMELNLLPPHHHKNLQLFSQNFSEGQLIPILESLSEEPTSLPTITTGHSSDEVFQTADTTPTGQGSATPFLLGVQGESLSSGSSAHNSCPYTPQNSFIEDYADGLTGNVSKNLDPSADILPTFNSREMIEKIEHKRKSLRDFELEVDFNNVKTIPFTPKNSFIDDTEAPKENKLDKEKVIERVSQQKLSESSSDLESGQGDSSAMRSCTQSSADESTISDTTTLRQNYETQTVDFPANPQHNKLLKKKIREAQGLDPDDDDESTLALPSEKARRKPRPNSLSKMKKITVNPDILNPDLKEDDQKSSMSSMSINSEIFSSLDEAATPDDLTMPNDDYTLTAGEGNNSDPIPEWSATEEILEERNWKTCTVCGIERRIDMKVIEPYKKVLSHGGYTEPDRQAIIVFGACYLPDRSRKDYDYVMDNLFFYVLVSLDQLVAEDYILIYFHGATRRSNMPSLRWLKRYYQMIDRRLRKNLKGLYLVHPTFWLKTIVIMTRPFISSKFRRKLRFVNNLQELSLLIPLEHVSIPEKVKAFDDQLKHEN